MMIGVDGGFHTGNIRLTQIALRTHVSFKQ